MNRLIPIFTIITYLLPLSSFAEDNSGINTSGYIDKEYALMCIQLNKDMNLASQQMLESERSRAEIKSKIHYLEQQIKKRRDLIEELDQRNSQENNENYNQLVSQFEDLVDERKTTIVTYNEQNQRHTSQHNSVIRLEKRFSTQCLQQAKISQELHQEVCQFETVRWCGS